MRDYPRPENEPQRLTFLDSLSLLDSDPDKNIDRITELAQRIFQIKIAAVTVLAEDRQWFKCVIGIDADETSRDVAICNHTISGQEIFEVTDLRAHPEFRDNPLVAGEPHFRYYAGAPLIIHGFALGSLCILDYHPRPALTERERHILSDLAALVVREIDMQSIVRESLALLSSHNEHVLPD